MKKYLFTASLTIFSIGMLSYSFFIFENATYPDNKVKGAEDKYVYLIPENSEIVSANKGDNLKTYSYTTSLSKDQIYEFYKQLGILKKWSQIDYNKLQNKNEVLDIEIQKEAGEKNLVTLRYTN